MTEPVGRLNVTARNAHTEFKRAAVLRLEAGEGIAAVADALKIRRKLLYEWRAAYRKLGAAGLNRKRGRKPGVGNESMKLSTSISMRWRALGRGDFDGLERNVEKILQLDPAHGKGRMLAEFRPLVFA